MKRIKKNSIFVCLMLCLANIATAQVVELNFDPGEKQIMPQIKWEDNKLFLTHPAGIFYQDYSSGELPDDWGDFRHAWNLYAFAGHGVNDFVINGDKILGITMNSFPYGELFIRSLDGGKTFEEFTPQIILDNLVKEGVYHTAVKGILQNPADKNELLIYGCGLYHSSDFGETWEAYYPASNVFLDSRTIMESNPSDFNMVIMGLYSMAAITPNAQFQISTDGGKKFKDISYSVSSQSDETSQYVYSSTEIAYHYSNPDIILLGGYPIVGTFDKGKTWKCINEELSFSRFDFDKRGSDRLYGLLTRGIYYSDDFGATWNELCEIDLAEDDKIIDFVQQAGEIFTYSKEYKVHEIDLELLESAIDEVSVEAESVKIKVSDGNLLINSQLPISTVDIYNIAGVKLISQEYSDGIGIADFVSGTYVARITTSDGKTISRKFNK